MEAEAHRDASCPTLTATSPPPSMEDAAKLFHRGDLVMAKIYGFPWWPSQVRSVRGLRPRTADAKPFIRVRFLHTKDNAEVPLGKCLPYFGNEDLSIVRPKMFKSKGLEKKFVTACDEARAWASAGAAPSAESEVWSDDDVVEEEEVEISRREASAHLDLWRKDGHDMIGKHVARYFGPSKGPKVKAYLAVITRWLPAEDHHLFHVVHDDGDEEDLEEEECRKAMALYSRQPEAHRRKHEQHVIKEERRRRAEERARHPRKNRTAFFFFSQSRRAGLLDAQPDLSLAELSKKVSALWRGLSAEERKPHDDAAAADLKRYLGECALAGVDAGHAGRLAGPLPALSAMGFFKERAEVALGVRLGPESELSPDVVALLRQGYEELPVDERDELEDLAAADADRYEDEAYNVFVGPNGEKERSMVGAWRIANQSAGAAADSTTAAQEAAASPVDTARLSGKKQGGLVGSKRSTPD